MQQISSICDVICKNEEQFPFMYELNVVLNLRNYLEWNNFLVLA